MTAQFSPPTSPSPSPTSSKEDHGQLHYPAGRPFDPAGTFIKHVDYYGIPMIFVNYAVFWGPITGVGMGDWQTGLVIGGTIQLMQLGVAGFGGSSI